MEHPARAKDVFTRPVLERIAQAIGEVEQATGADLEISVRDFRDAGEADLTIKQLAEKEFTALGLYKSNGQVGILIFILYNERKFYVCGDQGVNSRVQPDAWTDVADALRSHFANADYEGGVIDALQRIKVHLLKHIV
jgi:uncharacterized membrane protein